MCFSGRALNAQTPLNIGENRHSIEFASATLQCFLQAVCAPGVVQKQRAFSKFFGGEFNTTVEVLN
jgi:hypothetical protein